MLALLALALAQALEPAPPTPFDRVFPVELTADDPVLATHGPAECVEYDAQFSGTLHLWTKSEHELDLFLRVEDEGGTLIAEDDNSGGGNTPYVTLDVEPGRTLRVCVALASSDLKDRASSFELRALASPETDATRDAARAAKESLTEIKALGASRELEAARALSQRVVDELVSVPGAGDSQVVAQVAWLVGAEAHGLSDVTASRKARGTTWSHRSRTLPGDHPELQRAAEGLAITLKIRGDLANARILEERVLEVRSRTLSENDPELLRTQQNLAVTIYQLGDLAGARDLFERVLEIRSRTLPEDHVDVQRVRGNLASTLARLGDPAGARVLFERVLEIRSRTLPDDHLDLQISRENLASMLLQLGDFAGARALFERVLEVRSRTQPDEHPDLQRVRGNLATALWRLGDMTGARALQERVLEILSRTLPDDHTDLQTARQALAITIGVMGDLAGARALQEQVLEVRSRTLHEEHPDLQETRSRLADTLRQLGDLAAARVLEERVLAIHSRTLPEGHYELQDSREGVAITIAWQAARACHSSSGSRPTEAEREMETCVRLIGEMVRGESQAVRSLVAGSPSREAEERCASRDRKFGFVLSVARGYGFSGPSQTLEPELFVLSEMTRGAAIVSTELTRKAARSPKYSAMRMSLREASDELAALVRKGATSAEFDDARMKRESAERDIIALAREAPGGEQSGVEFDVVPLAARLGERVAAVGFRRFRRARVNVVDDLDSTGQPALVETAVESLCAFVVRGGASSALTFVDLGDIEPIATAVQAWRSGLGVASDTRGAPASVLADAAADVRARGADLRARIFDPLLPALAGVERVVIALDDVLHIVPIDALPLEDEALVGDRWRIETRATLTELLQAREAVADSGSLVAFGDVEYEAGESAAAPLLASTNVAAGPRDTATLRGPASGMLRGSAWSDGFSRLPATGAEVRGIARCYSDPFGDDAEHAARVLVRRDASREALADIAPRARYLHIATHGWFAPESIRSWSDPEPIDKLSGLGSRASGREQVKDMSPMLLCGLALAGANQPADAHGRIPGLVTAEEISTLDLTNCELAVLSACDTNVGERRAGQGVASLQKALQMAGARSVITSLWKVPDEATKELMLDFYRRLWVEKKPKWQALWEAKRKLRDAKNERGLPKYTTRDWAAWVLTGSPE